MILRPTKHKCRIEIPSTLLNPITYLRPYLEDRAPDYDIAIDPGSVDIQDNLRLISGMQKWFNVQLESFGKPLCRGLRFMNIVPDGRPAHFCHHPLCPSCWWRCQSGIAQQVARCSASRWLIRWSEPIDWDKKHTATFHTKFIVTNNRTMGLIGYSLSLGTELAIPTGSSMEEGGMYQRYIGIFAAKRRPRYEWRRLLDPYDTGIEYATHEVDGIFINTFSRFPDKDSVIGEYLGRLRFPGHLYQHENFSDYLVRFAPRSWGPTGIYKQWHRITRPSWVEYNPDIDFKEFMAGEEERTRAMYSNSLSVVEEAIRHNV